MDYSDDQLRKLRLAYEALAGLDELVMTLKVARRTPDALAAESLTHQALSWLARPSDPTSGLPLPRG
jgi:hypothetical protein